MQGAKTVDQALELLLALRAGPMTASDLAQATGINRSGVHRMLATLHSRGFVRRTGDQYRPGPAIVRLAGDVEPALRAASVVPMQSLSDKTGETVVLSVPDDMTTTAIHQVVGTRFPIRVEYEAGMTHPITSGADGRAILAYMSEAVVSRAMLRAQNESDLMAHLEQVRNRGYATSSDELRDGVSGIAAPVFQSKAVVASVSLIVPSARSTRLDEQSSFLIEAARAVGFNLESEPV